MSETSAGQRNRQKCFSILLRILVGADKSVAKKFALLLNKEGIITKDQSAAIKRSLDSGKIQEAVSSISDYITSREDGIGDCEKVLPKSDLPKNTKNILCAVAEHSRITDNVFTIVNSWNNLRSNQKAKKQCGTVWPGNESIVEDWPMHFVTFCITWAKEEDLDRFLKTIYSKRDQGTVTEEIAQQQQLASEYPADGVAAAAVVENASSTRQPQRFESWMHIAQETEPFQFESTVITEEKLVNKNTVNITSGKNESEEQIIDENNPKSPVKPPAEVDLEELLKEASESFDCINDSASETGEHKNAPEKTDPLSPNECDFLSRKRVSGAPEHSTTPANDNGEDGHDLEEEEEYEEEEEEEDDDEEEDSAWIKKLYEHYDAKATTLMKQNIMPILQLIWPDSRKPKNTDMMDFCRAKLQSESNPKRQDFCADIIDFVLERNQNLPEVMYKKSVNPRVYFLKKLSKMQRLNEHHEIFSKLIALTWPQNPELSTDFNLVDKILDEGEDRTKRFVGVIKMLLLLFGESAEDTSMSMADTSLSTEHPGIETTTTEEGEGCSAGAESNNLTSVHVKGIGDLNLVQKVKDRGIGGTDQIGAFNRQDPGRKRTGRRSTQQIEYRFRVTTMSSTKDKSMYLKIGDKDPILMKKIRDGIFEHTQHSAPAKMEGYWYILGSMDKSRHELFPVDGREVKRIVNRDIVPGSPHFIFDVALFEETSEAIQDLWGLELDKLFPEDFRDRHGAQLKAWLKQAYVEGWKIFVDDEEKVFRVQDKAIEKSIARWLKSGKDTNERSYAGIALLLNWPETALYNAQTTVLLEIVSSLDISELSTDKQQSLCQLLRRDLGVKNYEQLPNILNEFFQVAAPKMSEWLLAIPIQSLIPENNGDTTMTQTMVHKTERKFELIGKLGPVPPFADNFDCKSIREKYHNSVDLQQSLMELSDRIRSISLNYPAIIEPYQYLLSSESIVTLMQTQHALTESFNISNMLIVVSEYLQQRKSEKQVCTVLFRKSEKIFTEMLKRICKEPESTALVTSLHCDQKKQYVRTATSIMKNMKKKTEEVLKAQHDPSWTNAFLLWSLRIIFKASEWYKKLLNEAPDNEISGLLELIRQKMNLFIFDKAELQLCEDLFQTASGTSFDVTWKSALDHNLKEAVKKKWNKDMQFLRFFFGHILGKKYSASESSFRQVAEELVAKAKENSEIKSYITRILTHPMETEQAEVMRFFDGIFVATVGKEDAVIDERFKLCASWPFAKSFLEILSNNNQSPESSKSAELVAEIRKYCTSIRDLVYSGELEVRILENLIQNREQVDLIKALTTESDDIKEHIQKLVEKHANFATEQKYAQAFFQSCRDLEDEGITVLYEEIKDLYVKRSQSSKIKGFFTSKDIAELTEPYHGLTPEHIKEFQRIHSLTKNSATLMLWKDAAKEYQEKHQRTTISWDEMLQEIWKTVKNSVCSLAKSISTGSAKLYGILRIFNFTCGKEDELKMVIEEFCSFCGTLQGKELHVDQIRINQILEGFELEKYSAAHKWLADFKETFGLTGNFESLQRVTNVSNYQSLKLSDVSEGIFDNIMGPAVKKIQREQLQTLQQFSAQKDLIKWLNTKMNDPAEVKNMCDLVMVGARETLTRAVDTDSADCLLKSVQAFSPLIFNLKNVKGLDALLEKCEKVWKNVKSSFDILSKWKASGDRLPWFKTSEGMYGSEQKQSVSDVEIINRRGVYNIGRINANVRDNVLRLEDCLLLTIHNSEARHGSQKSEFNVSDLDDLQSKLTLIAGEDGDEHENIYQFGKLLGAVKNVAEAYLNLVENGCMLFHDCTITITNLGRTDYSDTLNLIIRFNEANESLTGAGNHETIHELARTLRDAHKRWSKYIHDKRFEHYYLNEFNTKQITYLCQQLAKRENIPSLPNQVLSLLSQNPETVLTANIIAALDEAFAIEDYDDQVVQSDNTAPKTADLSEIEKKKKAVRNLVKSGQLPENLAKAAVQAMGWDKKDDCLNWALLHKFKKDQVKNLVEEFDKQAFAEVKGEESECLSILHERSVTSLKEMISRIFSSIQTADGDPIKILNAICKQYHKKTSIITLEDFLSVEHLGKFLAILNREESISKPKAVRQLNQPFNSGQPNLIVCPEKDISLEMLSLYMENPADPLPTASEVLLCSDRTTEDEVERFMKRAMCKCKTKGQPIYCLAYPEKLNFNISKKVEKVFDMLSTCKYIDGVYQLVIFSANQHGYIAECFDKYRIENWTGQHNKSDVSKYLVDRLNRGQKPVVTVVTSNRSGVGKSRYIKKMSDALDPRWYDGRCDVPYMPQFVKLLRRERQGSARIERRFPDPLKMGNANMVLCHERDILQTLIMIYMCSAKQPFPSTSEILLCCEQTSAEECESFLRRAISRDAMEDGKIFCIAYPDKLREEIKMNIQAKYQALTSNKHAREEFKLVVLSNTSEYFSFCESFEVKSGEEFLTDVTCYLNGERGGDMSERAVANLTLVPKSGSCGNQSPTDHGNMSVYEDLASAWNKTTIRLLDKRVDTNHLLNRLLRIPNVRNQDKHFIHIDITPAVEQGLEELFFNLFVLGQIHNQAGMIWHKQNHHMYVVEFTKSTWNKPQFSENSVINMLPAVSCLSPTESLVALQQARTAVTEVIQESFFHEEAEFSEIRTKFSFLRDRQFPDSALDYQYYYDDIYMEQQSDPVRDLLEIAGVPARDMHGVMQLLSDQTRAKLSKIYKTKNLGSMTMMDKAEFVSSVFQRPYQYLKKHENALINLDDFQYSRPMGLPEDCIQILLKCCAMHDPSWAQIHYFVSLLNVQLQNCEESIFCQHRIRSGTSIWARNDLAGLKKFAVRFMIKMAQDFATPSLKIADKSRPEVISKEDDIARRHKLRRRWEDEAHPYVFFNDDKVTMSFVNVNINDDGDLLDANGEVSEKQIASKRLVSGLKRQGAKLSPEQEAGYVGVEGRRPKKTDGKKETSQESESSDRKEKLQVLHTVMDIPFDKKNCDPDPTYELTMDNVLKILGIHMRLRCNIPVIIMGETGCGKTRMVEFMNKLKSKKKEKSRMVTLKIHGGITATDIYGSVKKAMSETIENGNTTLFYDEANTTNAIYAIKEVVCDGTIDGDSFPNNRIKIIAACNPYMELSQKAIKKLEHSGLGYRVNASKTTDRLGTIPLRQLVYKVVSFPPSMQPFVWDFGQLSGDTEEKYIKQMTKHLIRKLKLSAQEKNLIDDILTKSQAYMRQRQDECKYVSLRDVERCLKIFEFFYNNAHKGYLPLPMYESQAPTAVQKTVHCLLQAVGACYHASLEERAGYRNHIRDLFERKGHTFAKDINEYFVDCQNKFLGNAVVAKNIARNEALRENVFLIVLCIQLQIPLFIVGKPGSSKSLAKSIVSDTMRGSASNSNFFRNLKEVFMESYQCSAQADAAGIEKVFNKCTEQQKIRMEKHKAEQKTRQVEQPQDFAAVVVLDEIGLAEDSQTMPLKVLHSLLECGSTENKTLTEFDVVQKCGFLGISNWALDPAKMNRGIFVTRSTPGEEDLFKTAADIFKKDTQVIREHQEIMQSLTKAYLEIYKDQADTISREYFGLRDYYSLIKMISAKTTTRTCVDYDDVCYAAQRNFSGGHGSHIETFKKFLRSYFASENMETLSSKAMIRQNLEETDSRFLLLLTNHHSAITLLRFVVENFDKKVEVIYGSSFPGDHTYTRMCQNINEIKVCMELGKTVILLDMTSIHESLYDALNQHYTMLANQRYVDIGLGGHRMKCRISKKFRLIVLEQKEVVYTQYPIPLINRLEKHHLESSKLLDDGQKTKSDQLQAWAKEFACKRIRSFKEVDAFIGYNKDTPSSIVLMHRNKKLPDFKHTLLQSATVDSVYRTNVDRKEDFLNVYTNQQVHDELTQLLADRFAKCDQTLTVIEVTSFSNILTESDRRHIEASLDLDNFNVVLCSLQEFETQRQYSEKLDEFFVQCRNDKKSLKHVLLIQCPRAHIHGSLLACARYGFLNKRGKLELDSFGKAKIIVAFLLSTQRQRAVNGNKATQLSLQASPDLEVIYVDDLKSSGTASIPLRQMYKKSLTDILLMGEQELSGSSDNQSNLLGLLRDTVCPSLAKVKRQSQEDDRNLACIEIVTQLLLGKNEVAKTFQRILLQKMIEIYRGNEMDTGDAWMRTEARSAEHLQEGGTFVKTLCLRIKRHLAKLLAFIVSRVDESNNLNFLVDKDDESDSKTIRVKEKDEWKTELWLEIFKQQKLKWKDMRKYDSEEFPVGMKTHKEVTSLKMPFSFALHRVWEDGNSNLKVLFNLFRSEEEYGLPVTSVMQKTGKHDEIMRAYAGDVVNQFFQSADITQGIKTHLTKILLTTSKQLKKGSQNGMNSSDESTTAVSKPGKKTRQTEAQWEFQKGDEIAAVLYCFKRDRKEMEMLCDIFEIYPEASLDFEQEVTATQSAVSSPEETATKSKIDLWIEEQKTSTAFVIHQLALSDLLDWVQEQTSCIKNAESCIFWMELAGKCKKFFQSSDLFDEKSKKQLMEKLEPIIFLDLLLRQLLPSTSTDDEMFQKYVDVIVNHAKRLLMPLKTMGYRDSNFLLILLNVLRMSLEEIKLRYLIRWQDPLCKICLQSYEDPVQLPCINHFTCHKCLIRLVNGPGRKQCPLCPTDITRETPTEPAKLSADQKQSLKNFTANCTSFFLEYLNQFCFSESGQMEWMDRHMEDQTNDAMEDQIKLFVRELIGPENNGMELETMAIDLNLSTKSNILDMILDRYGEFSSTEMQNLFGSLDERALGEAILVVLHCYESRYLKGNREDSQKRNFEMGTKLREWWETLKEELNSINFTSLETVAKIRYALTVSVDEIQKHRSRADDSLVGQYILAVMEICEDDQNESLKTFVVRTGCQVYGTDWFDYVKKHKKLVNLVPQYLLKGIQEVDHWVLLGNEYEAMKKSLPTNFIDYPSHFQQHLVLSEPMICSVAKFLAVIHAGGDGNQDASLEPLRRRLENTPFADLVPLAGPFCYNTVAGLSIHAQETVLKLAFFALCVVACKPNLMDPYFCLATNTGNLEKCFWPAMPVSFHASFEASGARFETAGFYKCPNGHPYSIGNCTRPVEEATCLDCGAVIGGVNYRSAKGNTRIADPKDGEQGYQLLNNSEDKEQPTVRMTRQGIALIHFVTHSCLLAAFEKDYKMVKRLLKCSPKTETRDFLHKKLKENIDDLSRSIGQNFDDSVILLYMCFIRMLSQTENEKREETSWYTLEGRLHWENKFKEVYLSNMFQDIESELAGAKATIGANKGNILYRFAYEMDSSPLPTTAVKTTNTAVNSVLWKSIKHPNFAHIEDATKIGGVLKLILRTPDLHMTKYLEDILSLQTCLINLYQNNKDLKDVESITFGRLYTDKKFEPKSKLDRYIEAWNKCYTAVAAKSDPIIREYFKIIDKTSSVAMAVPSSRGLGRCAKLFAEYIIDVHNGFLDKCSTLVKSSNRSMEVDVRHLQKPNYICIDKEEELLQMMQLHTAYVITEDDHGRHHHITYNTDALEKQVVERYVMYRPRIKKKTLPCIKYPQDIGIGSDWKEVREINPQTHLSGEVSEAVENLVASNKITAADVCEAVRMLTYAISYLAKIKSKPKLLHKYLSEDLMLSKAHLTMIPKSASTKHTLALYQRLTWHKAVHFVQRGLDPYKEALEKVKQEEIKNEATLNKLQEAFRRTDILAFQQSLNEVLIQVPDFRPDWSLKMQIFPYFEFIEKKDADWYKHIPEDICFQHVSHLFQLSVKGIDLPQNLDETFDQEDFVVE